MRPVVFKLFRICNSTPIEVVVENFNNQKLYQYNQVVGDGRPPLTPEEVIEYLDSDEEIVTQSPARVKSIFRQIVKTNRIPNSVKFDFMSSSTNGRIRAWLVGMRIMDEDAQYRINIRTIDDR